MKQSHAAAAAAAATAAGVAAAAAATIWTVLRPVSRRATFEAARFLAVAPLPSSAATAAATTSARREPACKAPGRHSVGDEPFLDIPIKL